MQRQLRSIALLGCVLCGMGCNSARRPNAANFAKAIDAYFVTHGEACTSIGRQFPIDVPASTPQSQYGFGPQLAALQQAGLVSETDTTAVVHGMLDALHGSSSPQRVRHYQLTSESQKYFRQVPGTFGPTGGFCYGQKAVGSIVKWSDPTAVNGVSQVEVTYTYRVINLAPWAGYPEIQRAFPDIAATVSGASKVNQTIGLSLTSAGWEVPGS